MLRKKTQKNHFGQTLLEYSLVVGAVLAIIVAMGPMIGRSTNGFIRLVADQLGPQKGAEQNFDNSQSHLDYSYTTQNARKINTRQETVGVINYVFNEQMQGTINSQADLGIH